MNISGTSSNNSNYSLNPLTNNATSFNNRPVDQLVNHPFDTTASNVKRSSFNNIPLTERKASIV